MGTKISVVSSFFALLMIVVSGCTSGTEFVFDADNGGLTLPEGFQAIVVADSIPGTRHIAINRNGDIYVATRSTSNSDGETVGLRDTDGDGRTDLRVEFGEIGGTGIDIHNGYLYASTDTSVVRYPLNENDIRPEQEPEVIVTGLPDQQSHAAKSITFDGQGNLYVNVGAPSNACMEQSRTPGSPGMDPCPLLETTGGIWQFSDSEPDQDQDDGTRYATGIRNAVAIDWNQNNSSLYMVQHGRDQLDVLFPELFDAADNAERTAEEFVQLSPEEIRPWPYCFYDLQNNQYVLSPEYGGNGDLTGRCEAFETPLVTFPAHHAPNDLLFYEGGQFPDSYDNGAFIAFHGSWNRAPLNQGGYRVVFQPMSDGETTNDWSVFADGFAGVDPVETPNQAEYRPVGLATGPDGSLYVADSVNGRIWRIMYTGGE